MVHVNDDAFFLASSELDHLIADVAFFVFAPRIDQLTNEKLLALEPRILAGSDNGADDASENHGSEWVKKWVEWGAGPRASQALILGAKARALLSGRFAASDDDVLKICKPILRHRLVLNFQAEADGIDADQVVTGLLEAVKP